MIPKKRRRASPWVRLGIAWTLIAAGAWLLLRVPIPYLAELPAVRNLLVVAGAIMLAGKALYDTLFYDRFPV